MCSVLAWGASANQQSHLGTLTSRRCCLLLLLLQSFIRQASNYGMLSSVELSLLEVIPSNLEQPATLAAAMGNAGRVRWGLG